MKLKAASGSTTPSRCGERQCPDLCCARWSVVTPVPAHNFILKKEEEKKSNDLNWVIHHSTDISLTTHNRHSVIRLSIANQKNVSHFHGITYQFLPLLSIFAVCPVLDAVRSEKQNKRSLNSVHVAFRFTYSNRQTYRTNARTFLDCVWVRRQRTNLTGRMCPIGTTSPLCLPWNVFWLWEKKYKKMRRGFGIESHFVCGKTRIRKEKPKTMSVFSIHAEFACYFWSIKIQLPAGKCCKAERMKYMQ